MIFISESALNKHLRVHTEKEPHQRISCEKKFSKKCNLVAHMRVPSGDKPFQCSHCEKNVQQRAIWKDTWKLMLLTHPINVAAVRSTLHQKAVCKAI